MPIYEWKNPKEHESLLRIGHVVEKENSFLLWKASMGFNTFNGFTQTSKSWNKPVMWLRERFKELLCMVYRKLL